MKFQKLSPKEAQELGEGNTAGWKDYVMARPPRITKEEAETTFDRGYLAGYRLAGQGKRPMLMRPEKPDRPMGENTVFPLPPYMEIHRTRSS